MPIKNESEEKHRKHTYPTDGEITEGGTYGPRIHPVTGEKDEHKGLDFNTKNRKYGESVQATESGVVVGIKTGQKKGDDQANSVTIQYSCGKRGGAYAHVKASVKKNTKVNQGDIIGNIDDSGLTTGPHVHYQGYKTDVSPWEIIDPTHWFE